MTTSALQNDIRASVNNNAEFPLGGSRSRTRSPRSCDPVQPSMETKNLIILDWDDTILPTYVLSQNNFATPDHSMEITLSTYSFCVKLSLEKIKELGNVIIVTNSAQGWVEKSCKMFLPSVWPVIEDVAIVSARTETTGADIREMSHAKFTVFRNLVQTYNPSSIMSLGDGVPERNALWNLNGDGLLRKCLNFRRWPSVIQLATQHVVVYKVLEEACSREQDIEWVLYN